MEINNKNLYTPQSAAVSMPVMQSPTPHKQKDFLGWSIFNLTLCCVPIGLVALIYSVKTRDARYANNDIIATKYSRTTWKLNVLSLVVGILLYILFFTLFVFLPRKLR
ncbi:dispanin subfamily A member 2b-like [Hyperolius riggenbachi]|uniref:dispanin subfamily A member 2b-like n=1 Tax=Hyperolius riggenbachi TaxID=752182 RepID=UPI0035A345FE